MGRTRRAERLLLWTLGVEGDIWSGFLVAEIVENPS